MLYHLHSFDDDTGVMLKNIPDGLSGLRIRPSGSNVTAFHIDDFLIEFLSTLDQSGPIFTPWNRLSGADNYFNNSQYREGGVYKSHILGNPFITLKQDVKAEYQTPIGWAAINNRLQMAHVGMRATVAHRMNLMVKVSYSRNQGVPNEPLAGSPGSPTQLSSLAQPGMPLRGLGGLSLTASVAADPGQLYAHSVGGYIGLRKTVWQR